MSTLTLHKGECVSAQINWRNEDGTAIDISGRLLGIQEAHPPELVGGTLVPLVPGEGTATLEIPATLVALMRPGRSSWFRLYSHLPDGCRDVSPKIWVDIQ